MRWIVVITIGAVALAGNAHAQMFTTTWPSTVICPENITCGYTIERAMTGDADLDRAMAICDTHNHPTNVITPTNPPQQTTEYEKPYGSACSKVNGAWLKSAAAAAEKARRDREKVDLDFLNGYAARLPEALRP